MTDQLDTPESGYLELFLGPMWAGKTSELVDIYHFAKDHDIKCIAINHTFDLCSKQLTINTHDDVSIPCVSTDKLTDIFDTKTTNKDFDYDIILINEGQFFPDLYETVYELVEKYKKKVYICGLDGDFQRNKFGKLLDLIPLCDNIIKLKAKCVKCKGHAIFSKRLSTEEQQVVIGSSNYAPMCRECYSN